MACESADRKISKSTTPKVILEPTSRAPLPWKPLKDTAHQHNTFTHHACRSRGRTKGSPLSSTPDQCADTGTPCYYTGLPQEKISTHTHTHTIRGLSGHSQSNRHVHPSLSYAIPTIGPAHIHHRSPHFATQFSHVVDRAGWQAKMASIEFSMPWCNAHGPHHIRSKWLAAHQTM